jgi:hypothetical protein
MIFYIAGLLTPVVIAVVLYICFGDDAPPKAGT